MEYEYKIISIDKKQRWLFLQADEWDIEEPDSFICLVKKICGHVSGELVDIGDYRYKITNDPCKLIYKWDTLFGITIVYPPTVTSGEVIEFLEDIIC